MLQPGKFNSGNPNPRLDVVHGNSEEISRQDFNEKDYEQYEEEALIQEFGKEIEKDLDLAAETDKALKDNEEQLFADSVQEKLHKDQKIINSATTAEKLALEEMLKSNNLQDVDKFLDLVEYKKSLEFQKKLKNKAFIKGNSLLDVPVIGGTTEGIMNKYDEIFNIASDPKVKEFAQLTRKYAAKPLKELKSNLEKKLEEARNVKSKKLQKDKWKPAYGPETVVDNNILDAVNILEDQIDRIDTYLKDDNHFWKELITREPDKLLSLGINPLIRNLKLLTLKNKAPEELSTGERLFIDAMAASKQLDKAGLLEGSQSGKMGQSAEQSLEMVGQFIVTGGYGTGAEVATKSAIKKGIDNLLVTAAKNGVTAVEKKWLINILNAASKVGGRFAKVSTMTALSPSSYNFGFDDYYKNINYVKNTDGEYVPLLTAAQKESFIKDARTQKYINNYRIEEIKNDSKLTKEEKEKEITKLINSNSEIENTEAKILDENNTIPEDNFGKSMAKGVVQNFWETASEMVVGPAFDKLAGKIKFLKAINKEVNHSFVGKLYGKGKNIINKISKGAFKHLEGPGIIQSLPGEIVEEISTQFAPQIGMDWEGYKDQVAELKDPQWWLDTTASIVTIGSLTGGVGLAVQLNNLRSSEYRERLKSAEKRKEELDKILNTINKQDISDEDMQTILASTGNTFFNPKYIAGLTSKLRLKGRGRQANFIERKNFSNLIVRALKTGQLEDLEKAFNKSLKSKNLSEKTKNNILEVKPILEEAKKFTEKYGEEINFEELSQSFGKKIYGATTVKELKNNLDKLVSENTDIFNKYAKAAGLDVTMQDVLDGKVDEKVMKRLKKTNIGNINEIVEHMFLHDMMEAALFDEQVSLQQKLAKQAVDKAKQIHKTAKDNTTARNTTKENEAEFKEEIRQNSGAQPIINKAAENAEQSEKTAETPVSEDTATPTPVADALRKLPDVEKVEQLKQKKGKKGGVVRLNDDELLDVLGAPVKIGKEHKKLIDRLAKAISVSYSKSKNFTLDNFIARAISDMGNNKALHNFNILVEAWAQGTGEKLSESKKEALFENFFGNSSITSLLQEEFDDMGAESESVQDKIPVAKSVQEEEPKVEEKEVITSDDAIEVVFKSKKINQPQIKVAFLGLDYDIVDEEGNKLTVSETINPQAHPVLHWDNFKPGDKIKLKFNWEYMRNPDSKIRLWSEIKNIVQKIAEIEKRRKEELKKVHENAPLKRNNPIGDNIYLTEQENKIVSKKINKILDTSKTTEEAFERISAITVKGQSIVFRSNDRQFFNDYVERRVKGETQESFEDFRDKRKKINAKYDAEIQTLKSENKVKPTIMSFKEFVETELSMSWDEFENKTYSPEGQKQLLQNEKLLHYAPTIMSANIDGNFQEVGGGINTVDWWNPTNVAMPVDAKTGKELKYLQDKIIKEAREQNLKTRKQIVENNEVELTVEDRRNVGFNSLYKYDKAGNLLPLPFQSVLQAFKGNKDAMNKYSSIAVFYGENLSNDQDGKTLTVGGKKISVDSIENYDKFRNLMLENLLEQGKSDLSGMMVLVYQTGKDTYAISSVDASHEEAQEKMAKQEEIVNEILRLGRVLSGKEKGNTVDMEDAKKLQSFLNTIGVTLTNKDAVFLRIALAYPRKIKSRGGRYFQDLSKKWQNTLTIDLTGFNSIRDFHEALNNGELNSIKQNQVARHFLSTPLIFSEIENVNGNKIWSSISQPVITLQLPGAESKKIDFENVAGKQLKKIEEQIEKTQDKEERKFLKEVKKELEKQVVEANNALKPSEDTVEAVLEEKQQEEPDVPYEATLEDIHDITDELVFRALKYIDVDKKLTILDFKDVLLKAYDELLNEIKKDNKKEAAFLEENKNDLVGITPYKYSAVNKLFKLFEISTDDIDESEIFDEKENYAKKDYERDLLKSISFKTKILLSGIKDNRVQAYSRFPGINRYMDMSEVFDGLHQLLSDLEKTSKEDIKKEVEKLQKINNLDFAFLEEVFDKIFSLGNDKLLNEILYNVAMPKLKMQFLLVSGKNGNVVKKLNANTKSPAVKLKREWLEQHRNSKLLQIKEEGLYTLDSATVKEIKESYKKLQKEFKDKTINLERVFKFLDTFGVTLAPRVKEILSNSLYTGNQYDIAGKELNIFDSKKGLIPLLYRNLLLAEKQIKQGKNLAITERYVIDSNDKFFNILGNNTGGALKKLIDLQTSVTFTPMTSIYTANKTVNAYQKPKIITNIIKRLKTEKGLLQAKTATINTGSLLLDLLSSNEEFKDYFDMSLLSLESYKIAGSKYNDTGAESLSDAEFLMVAMGMLAHNDGALFTNDIGLEFRKGNILFPTLSDSGQIPMLHTALLNINNSVFDKESNTVSDSIYELLIEQLVLPEVLRIAKSKNVDVNVKGHNTGKQFFFAIPTLNAVTAEVIDRGGKTVERTLVDILNNFKNLKGEDYSSNPNSFMSDYKEQIKKELKDWLNFEVTKVKKDIIKFGFYNEKTAETHFLDEKYLKSKNEDRKTALSMLSYEFVINTALSLKDIQNLFASDAANFYKNVDKTEFGLPEITISEILKHYYPEEDIDISNFNKKELSEKYPEVLASKEYKDLNVEERFKILLPIFRSKSIELFNITQNNLSKRLKALISPGLQFPNLDKIASKYTQIFVNDVETSSEVMDYLVETYYNNDEKILNKIFRYKELEANNNKNDAEKEEFKNLFKELNNIAPLIAPYLKIASTDAQEMSTWAWGLNQLIAQGRLEQKDYNTLYDKFLAQEKDIELYGYIQKENLLTKEERLKFVMQPSKPLYSGNIYESKDGYTYNRLVYIKTSSFVLLPEMTQNFQKLDQLRKNLNKFEERDDKNRKITKPVRVVYGSGAKVGAPVHTIDIDHLYKDNINIDKVIKSSVELTVDNFFIQLDKPYKFAKLLKQGRRSENSRGTQFEKILLGDGINKIKAKIFDATKFSEDLLKSLDIEVNNNKISGPDLTKIYNELYKREQELLTRKLLDKFGLQKTSDNITGSPMAMEKLSAALKERLTNPQDLEALNLVYYTQDSRTPYTKQELKNIDAVAIKAEFAMPLWLLPNSWKFESVLNSIVSKNNLKLKMPGGSGIASSQEGFEVVGLDSDYKNSLKELKKKGLITTKNFNGKLEPTVVDGELVKAQVFMPNKTQIYNKKTGRFEHLDLTEKDEEGNYKYLNEFGQLNLPEDILSLFSFRIPTSAHQSGVVLEIVGFLPENMGDIMVVPKDHTVQIGEDYDIDIRYYYNFNLTKDFKGNIKKVEIPKELSEEEMIKLAEANIKLKRAKAELFKKYFKIYTDRNGLVKTGIDNPYWYHNRHKLLEIAFLKEDLKNESNKERRKELSMEIEYKQHELLSKDNLKEKSKELKAEYDSMLVMLSRAYNENYGNIRSAYENYKLYTNNLDFKHLAIENQILEVYHSIMGNESKKVQALINRVLSTDRAENTAKAMDEKLKRDENYKSFYSYHTQRDIFKSGTEGQIGIGLHSNAVVINSILQQSEHEHKLYKDIDEKEDGSIVYIGYNIRLGKLVFDGILGKVNSETTRFSEVAMESQNSATDNQKLQVMNRRNENRYTMGVLQIMQSVVPDFDGVRVNGQEFSYSSLFLNQPILRRFTELMYKYSSQLSKTYDSSYNIAIEQLKSELQSIIPDKYFVKDKDGNPTDFLIGTVEKEYGSKLTSKRLWNSLTDDNLTEKTVKKAINQYYILQAFGEMHSAHSHYNKLVQAINLETPELGISYFDVIAKNNFYTDRDIQITNLDRLLGEQIYVDNDSVEEYEKKGYIRLNRTPDKKGVMMVKPNTFFSHKVVNTLSNGYNLYKDLFPYEHPVITGIIRDVLRNARIDPSTKKGTETKYEIISAIKDYIYNNATVFRAAKDNIVNKLFFEDYENNKKSLARYLLDLKNTEVGKELFNKAFFKDLEFEINSKDFPSIIKFINNSKDVLTKDRIYNTLEALSTSNRKLPDFNDDKNYTYSKLIRDLFLYSLVANQQKGATGFRQHMPLSLFHTHGIDVLTNNVIKSNNLTATKILFEGGVKSIEKYFGKDFNEDGVLKNNLNKPVDEIIKLVAEANNYIKDNYEVENAIQILNKNGDLALNLSDNRDFNGVFFKQFVQHNPQFARKIGNIFRNQKGYGGKVAARIALDNGYTLKDLAEKRVPYLVIDEVKVNKKFSVFVDDQIISFKLPNGSLILYEKIGKALYRFIPTLGSNTFNEYYPGKDLNTSRITKNNLNSDAKPISIKQLEKTRSISLSKLLYDLQNSTSSYGAIFKLFKGFINTNDVKVSLVEKDGFIASYRVSTNTIEIGKKFFDNSSKEELEQAISEEFLHHITTTLLNKYVDIKGIKDGRIVWEEKAGIEVPDEVNELFAVYNFAVRHYIKKYGEDKLLSKMKDNNNLTEDEFDMTAYRLSNIHEFIAGLFIQDSDFSKEMAITKYRNTEESVLERFGKALLNLIKRILPVGTLKDSVSETTLENLINVLKKANLKTEKSYKRSAEETITNDLEEGIRKVTAEYRNISELKAIAKHYPAYVVNNYKNYGDVIVVENSIYMLRSGRNINDLLSAEDAEVIVNTIQKQLSEGQNKSSKQSSVKSDSQVSDKEESVSEGGFQGYVGGFENKGKGTSKGDGKDKAMRDAANIFIGEIVSRRPSSSLTSAKEIGKKFGINEPNISEKLYSDDKDIGAHRIYSGKANRDGKNVVMLARNGKLKGKELLQITKDLILQSHQNNSEFIVGDMPDVDSQFIDYLQEIGAKFKIYHTGNVSRIKIKESENNNQSKTETGNVKIPFKPNEFSKMKEYVRNSNGNAIYSLRGGDKVNFNGVDFGNPFTHLPLNKTNGAVKQFPTVKEAVQAYKDWLTTDKYDNITTDNTNNKFKNSLFRGQRNKPYIDDKGNLILKPTYEQLSKDYGISLGNKQLAISYGKRNSNNPYIIEIDKDYIDKIFPLENVGTGQYGKRNIGDEGEERIMSEEKVVIPKKYYNIRLLDDDKYKNLSIDKLIDKYIEAKGLDNSLDNMPNSEDITSNSDSESVLLQELLKYFKTKKDISTYIANKNKEFIDNLSEEELQKYYDNGVYPEDIVPFKDNIATSIVKDSRNGVVEYTLFGRKQKILKAIESGELKGKEIIYYKELGEPSHANVLDELINGKQDDSLNAPLYKQLGFSEEEIQKGKELKNKCK